MGKPIPKFDPSLRKGKSLLRSFEWGNTPLGPMREWSDPLLNALALCEKSPSPTIIFWGPEFRLIYNDAFTSGPLAAPSEALARPARDVFRDIWPSLGRQLQKVMETGEGCVMGDYPGSPVPAEGDSAAWTHTLIPITGPNEEVLGVFAPALAALDALANRRLSLQMELFERTRKLTAPDQVRKAASQLLGEYLIASDVGFGHVEDERIFFGDDVWTARTDSDGWAGKSLPLNILGASALSCLRAGDAVVLYDRESKAPDYVFDAAAIFSALGLPEGSLILEPLLHEEMLKEILFVLGDAERVWKNVECTIVRDATERAWEAIQRTMAEQSLRESEEHYRYTVELNPLVTWTSLPDGRINRVSRRWEEWTGRVGVGANWVEAVHPDDKALAFSSWLEAVETGQPHEVDCRIRHRDGSYRWVKSRAFPRFDSEGRLLLWYGTIEDIHDMKLALESQNLLLHELNHRIKNTLSIVQGIAFQTFRGDLSLLEARLKFDERLIALSRASDTLIEQNWSGVWLDRLAQSVLNHLPLDRFIMHGPPVWLWPRISLLLSLVLHELGTNATKYGSLSVPGGKVFLSWMTSRRSVSIEWKEQGGPPVTPPENRGFGSKLIGTSLAADLGGSATLLYEADGLRCRIEFPASPS